MEPLTSRGALRRARCHLKETIPGKTFRKSKGGNKISMVKPVLAELVHFMPFSPDQPPRTHPTPTDMPDNYLNVSVSWYLGILVSQISRYLGIWQIGPSWALPPAPHPCGPGSYLGISVSRYLRGVKLWLDPLPSPPLLRFQRIRFKKTI